jgi:hypothetical protein
MPAMRPYRLNRSAAALSAALFCFLFPSNAAPQRAVPPFRIEALKAMLFYAESGTFSADLFGPSAPKLQNVSTGVGQATATLIVVEIAGPPNRYSPNRKVSLTATAGNRSLLTRTLPLGRPSDDGKFYAAFWLYDTGCTPISLKARILGQTQDSALQKTLDFRCGD